MVNVLVNAAILAVDSLDDIDEDEQDDDNENGEGIRYFENRPTSDDMKVAPW